MSRQIGSALGVAILIAILGTPAPGEALDAFDRAWTFMAIVSGAAFLAFLALGRVRVAGADAPAALRTSARRARPRRPASA